MNRPMMTLALALALTGCGGGDQTAPQSPTASSPAPVPPTAVSTPPAPTVVSAPPTPNGATQFTSPGFNQQASDMMATIRFTGAASLSVIGDKNQFWVSSANDGGAITINGTANMIVIQDQHSTTVNISGTGNVLYLPAGSQVLVQGSGAAATKVAYYGS